MKIAPECAACIQLQLMRTLEHRKESDYQSVQQLVMAELGRKWATYDNPAIAIDGMYKIANKQTGMIDAYAQEKIRANTLGQQFWQSHALPVDDLAGRVAYAAAANLIDAGLDGNPENLFLQLNDAIQDGLGHDDSPQFFGTLPPKAHLLYLTDNAGEIVFDRELIRALAYRSYTVSVIVRHHPFLNDVTRTDVDQVHLGEVAYEILDLGDNIASSAIAPSTITAWRQAYQGFIVKGIANLESLSHWALPHPSLFLYRAKCPPSARLAQAQWNQNIAWLQRIS